MSPKNRFTLIELLVVVAIIAILAAMLLPALGRAKQAAYTAVCLSQTKQQALAVFYYADDADHQLPPIKIGGHKWNDPRSYYLLLTGSYLPAQKVWSNDWPNGWELRSGVLVCPAVTKRQPWYDWVPLLGQQMVNYRNRSGSAIVGPPDGQLELLMYFLTFNPNFNTRVVTSYALNGGITNLYVTDPPFPSFDWSKWSTPGQRLEQITKPDNTWMLSDLGPGQGEYGLQTPAFRHLGLGCNFAYFDGHAVTHRPNELDAGNQTVWGVQRLADIRLQAHQ